MALTKWMKFLAVGNLVEGLAGLIGIGSGVLFALSTLVFPPSRDLPYFLHAFYLMLAANVAFMGALFASAFLLWQLRRSGLRLVWRLLICEGIYLACIASLPALLARGQGELWHRLTLSVWGALAFANLGLFPQVVTAYPLWAGALSIWAWRKSSEPQPPTGKQPALMPVGFQIRQGSSAALVARALAIASALEVLIGVFGLRASWSAFHTARGFALRGFTGLQLIYWTTLLANLFLLGTLALSAYLLWKLERAGILLLCWVLGTETLFWVAVVTFPLSHFWSGANPNDPLKAVFLTASAGTMLQVATAYPIIAVLGILFLVRSARRSNLTA